MTEKRREALSFFVGQGWTPQQAAGLVANLEAESGLRPDAVGDGGQAYGIAQWHPPRQANFAAVIGKDIRGSSLEEQLAFVHAELRNTEKAAGDALASCTTAAEAGACVSTTYERPADREGEAAKRALLAEIIFAEYSQAAPEQPQTHAPEAPAIPAPPPTPQEAPMGAGLILGLIQTLLPMFSGGAQAKIAPILSGLTGQPVQAGSGSADDRQAAIFAFVNQMMQTVLAASGHADPAKATDQEKIQATAAVMASPALVQKVEDDAMARLEKMQPTFDRLAAIDKAANEAAIAGKDAAGARGRADVWDMAKALVFSSEGLIWFTMALLCAAVIVQIVLNDSHEPSGVLVGMIGPLLMMIYKNRAQPFDYRFDGTPSSNAANAINAELARKP